MPTRARSKRVYGFTRAGEDAVKALLAHGCERVFTRGSAKQFIDRDDRILHPGDTLAVLAMTDLDGSLPQTLRLIRELGLAGVTIAAINDDIMIAPGSEAARLAVTLRHNEEARTDSRATKLGPDLLERAKQLLLLRPDLDMDTIAREVGVTRQTLHRHLPGGRTGLARSAA